MDDDPTIPSLLSNNHYQCASDTEDLRDQQQFVEKKDCVSMSVEETALVVREQVEIPRTTDPTAAQKKPRVPPVKKKAEKKKPKTKRWTKVKELRSAKEQLALAEVQDEHGVVLQGRREVWEPNHDHDEQIGLLFQGRREVWEPNHDHDEQIDFTPTEEE
jgi:hypothetical protein